jgi:hypothetical protein
VRCALFSTAHLCRPSAHSQNRTSCTSWQHVFVDSVRWTNSPGARDARSRRTEPPHRPCSALARGGSIRSPRRRPRSARRHGNCRRRLPVARSGRRASHSGWRPVQPGRRPSPRDPGQLQTEPGDGSLVTWVEPANAGTRWTHDRRWPAWLLQDDARPEPDVGKRGAYEWVEVRRRVDGLEHDSKPGRALRTGHLRDGHLHRTTTRAVPTAAAARRRGGVPGCTVCAWWRRRLQRGRRRDW